MGQSCDDADGWVCARVRQEREAAARLLLRLLSSPRAAAAAGVSHELCAGWLRSVPRLLWELRDRRPVLTTLLLKTLRSAACFAAPGSPMAATLVALETELAPFFYLPAAALAALAAPVTVAAAAAPSPKVSP